MLHCAAPIPSGGYPVGKPATCGIGLPVCVWGGVCSADARIYSRQTPRFEAFLRAKAKALLAALSFFAAARQFSIPLTAIRLKLAEALR